jgi:rare lipoprotein A (peptidoglycan hydrolase)
MYAQEDTATVIHKKEMVLPADITAGLLGLIKGNEKQTKPAPSGADFTKTLGTKKIQKLIKLMVKKVLARLVAMQKGSNKRFSKTRKVATAQMKKQRLSVVKNHNLILAAVKDRLAKVQNTTKQRWSRSLTTTKNHLSRMLTATRSNMGKMAQAVAVNFGRIFNTVAKVGQRIRAKLAADWSASYGIMAKVVKRMVDVVNELMPDSKFKADVPPTFNPGTGDASGYETRASMGLAGAPGTGDSGMASWYGPGFYGNRTASGALYSPSHWGVAHKSLPFGTMLKINYGGKTVKAPVTDRGPFIGNRVLDLSNAVAKALGFGGVGMVNYERTDGGPMGMDGGIGSLDSIKYKVNEKTLHGKFTKRLIEWTRGEMKKYLETSMMAAGTYSGEMPPGASISGLKPHVARWVQMLINKFGIRMSSGFRPGARTARGTTSLHASGRAADLVGGGAALTAAANMARTLPGIDEVIWQAPGHYDHLHVGFYKLGGYSEKTQAAVVHPNEWILPEAKLQSQIKKAILEAEGAGKHVTQNVDIYPQKVEEDAGVIARKLAWKLKTEGI